MKFNLKLLALSFLTLSAATIMTIGHALADESLSTKAKEVGNDTRRGVKNAARKVKEKTCEMVNGKMDCAVQKTGNAFKKGADNVEDAID